MNEVLITTTTFGKENRLLLDLCKRGKLKIILNPYNRKIKPEELIELGKGVTGIIAGTELITQEVLLKLPKLKVISRCGTGLDNIDLDAAKRLGIKVFNTPDAPICAVAELTVGLILNLLRKVYQADHNLKNGVWEKPMGNLLYGKKVGIIGFGRIGKKVAKILSVFKVRIAFYDVAKKPSLMNCSRKGLKDILRWADIVTVHVSASKKRRYVIGKKELNLMRKGSWLINLSRGGVVDEGALYHALKTEHLSGAALDVFENEPYVGCLRQLNNVILTPHIGSYAKEARIKMEIEAVENLLKNLKGV